MRILYCTNQVNVHGGIERILSQKINYWIKEKGYEVFLTTFEQSEKPGVYSLDDRLNRIDLNIDYSQNYSYYHPKNLIKVWKHYFRLKALIAEIKPDVIVSISYTPDQFFLPFIDKKIPKVKELHSSGIVVGMSVQKENSIGGIFRRKLTNIFKKYDALVLLNQDETHYFEGCKTVVIHNFTDFVSNSDQILPKEKIVIAAGRIAPVKRFQELIYIWKLINNDFPEWKVKIFGDGDLKTTENLQELIKKLNLTSSFFLLPSISTIQVEMQKAAIYAMTSETECFPMVLLEAQVCGLPIVSYDCPNGPRNIINHASDGFLIPPNDRIGFAQKLSELMKNESKRNEMGNNSKQNVKKFSKEKVMPEWDKLFIKLTVKN